MVGGTVVGATTLVGTATGVTVGPEASTTGGRSLWSIGGTINVAASTLADSPINTASHGRVRRRRDVLTGASSRAKLSDAMAVAPTAAVMARATGLRSTTRWAKTMIGQCQR